VPPARHSTPSRRFATPWGRQDDAPCSPANYSFFIIHSSFFIKKAPAEAGAFLCLLLLAEGVESRERERTESKVKSGGSNNVFVFKYYHGQGRHFKILFHYFFLLSYPL